MIDTKIDEAVTITYQPARAQSGLTVTMEIYDETGSKDVVNFPDVTMTEVGTSGRYAATFTPDALGVWTVMTHWGTNRNPQVQTYRVNQYDIDDAADTDPPSIV